MCFIPQFCGFDVFINMWKTEIKFIFCIFQFLFLFVQKNFLMGAHNFGVCLPIHRDSDRVQRIYIHARIKKNRNLFHQNTENI